MRLLVTLPGHSGPAELTLTRNGSDVAFSWKSADGELVETAVSAVEVEPGAYSVLIDGRSYLARVITAPRGLEIDIAGRRYPVEVRDPRGNGRKTRSGFGEGRISAPMPGKVVRVLVAEGDTVEMGDGVVVVEAMKMQNEMKAPKAGRIANLLVSEGSTVAAGETLAEIE